MGTGGHGLLTHSQDIISPARGATPPIGLAQGNKPSEYYIMKKVKIEFNYPEQNEHATTFSLTIDNMDIKSAKGLARLSEMIERHYKEYMALMYNWPAPPSQSQSDTQ